MENLNDPTEQLKSILANLQKCVECPVCLETVKPSFKLCVRGHAFCVKCTVKLEKCPLCEEIFTLENPICLKNMLEALPHSCCYSDAGCPEIVEPRSDHETFCGYRPINCLSCKGKNTIPLVQFLDHCEKYHRRWLIDEESIHKPWNLSLYITYQAHTPVFIFNNLFWIIRRNDSEGFKIDFQATPIGKLKHDYFACIVIEKGNFIHARTLKAGVEVLSSCFIKGKGFNLEYGLDEHCMKIPKHEKSQIGNNGIANCKISFYRV